MSQESSSSSSSFRCPSFRSTTDDGSRYACDVTIVCSTTTAECQQSNPSCSPSIPTTSSAQSYCWSRSLTCCCCCSAAQLLLLLLLPAAAKMAKPLLFTGAPNTNVDTWLYNVERYLIGTGINDDINVFY